MSYEGHQGWSGQERDGGGGRGYPSYQSGGAEWQRSDRGPDRRYQRDGGGGGGSGGGGYSSSAGDRSDMYVEHCHLGRIIGKGGSKIRELQDNSGCYIKIYSDQVENGKVKITLSGESGNREAAKSMISDLDKPFNYDRGGGSGGDWGSRGGDSYGRSDRGGGGGGGRRTCYQCGAEGHFARECPNSQQQQQY